MSAEMPLRVHIDLERILAPETVHFTDQPAPLSVASEKHTIKAHEAGRRAALEWARGGPAIDPEVGHREEYNGVVWTITFWSGAKPWVVKRGITYLDEFAFADEALAFLNQQMDQS